jgi:hypothetical protein
MSQKAPAEDTGQELQRLASNVPVLQSLAELSAVIEKIEAGVLAEVDAACARPLKIESAADAEMMAAAVREARDVMDLVKDRHGAVKKFAHQLHKFITTQEGRLLDRVNFWMNGDRNTKGANQLIAAWDLEQQRIREKAQREAQAALDKQHAQDIERTAKQLEKKGEPAQAEQVRQSKAYTRPMAYVPPTAKLEGTSIVQEYDFEIINADAVPRHFCVPDESKIKKQIKVLGKDTVIAGVRIFPLDPKANVRR